jgi:hypothetical protein
VVDVAVEVRPAGPVLAEPVEPLVLDARVPVDVEWAVEPPCASVTEPRKEQAQTSNKGSKAAARRAGDVVMPPR